MELTVATFNIHHGEGTDGRLDLERTAAAIAATGAGLIALQELDRGFARSGGVDQPAELAELTGLDIHFFPTVRRGEGEYGIALASSDALIVEVRTLPRLGEEEPRGALQASWRGVRVVGVHLATRRAARRLQVPGRGRTGRAIERARPGARRFQLDPPRATALAERRPRRRRRTGPHGAGAGGGRRIDHVLAGGGARVMRTWTVSTDASDHVPLVARIEI